MADGNLVRQSNVGKGSVVFGPTVYDVPLLPYERELIKTIGITEEEYRKFAAEVRRKGVVRPAEYEHIPDIQAGGYGEAILISIAISLVMTGVNYLLTPKPKMPEASKRSQLDLGSVNAGNRFTQSRGFDTLNDLADYGAPVPIIFGLYDDETNVGGMLITPKLVWSRMFSHGTQQSAKLMFVVGEQGVTDDEEPDGIEPPSLEGIFLGNNALDAIHKDFFAFYWKRNTTTPRKTRIRFSDIVHGTNGTLDSGDPSIFSAGEKDEDAFTCPNNDSDNSKNFCHAYSLSNNTQFGVHAAVPNGNGYRVNYETVSVIEELDPDNADKVERQQGFDKVLRRIKIVGDDDKNINVGSGDALREVKEQGMEGKGRQYSPRMGLVELTKKSDSSSITVDGLGIDDKVSDVVEVAEGDEVKFVIDPSKIPEDKYRRTSKKRGESVDDINQTVASEQIAADDVMQVGEQFAIGNTLWKVAKRRLTQYDPDAPNAKRQIITLRCLSVDESRNKKIGLVSEKLVIKPEGRDFISDKSGIGAGFFPITRVSTGLVRNNRPAVVTEIGIRSRVFQRLNGLCAFNTVPSPEKLIDFDKNEVQVRSGTYNGHIKRTSVFQVFVRQAGLDENGNSFNFEKIDYYFAVTGSKPVDQYNSIRFIHRAAPVELEYKFVSIPGSELRSLADEQEIISLSGSFSDEKTKLLLLLADVGTLGRFDIKVAGTRIRKDSIKANKEFIRDPKTIEVASSATSGLPGVISSNIVLPQSQEENATVAKAIRKTVNISSIDPLGIEGFPGKNGAFFHEIFGRCDNDPINEGGFKETKTRESFGIGRWVIVKWTVQKVRLPDSHYARVNNGVTFTWKFISCELVSSSDQFAVNNNLDIKRGLGSTEDGGSTAAYTNSNPFVRNHPNGTMTFSGQIHIVTDIDVVRGPLGREQAYYYEVFGDPRGLEPGQSKTVARTYAAGLKTIKFKLTATVEKLDVRDFAGKIKVWNHPNKIEVVEIGTTTNWTEDEAFNDLVVIASDNPYKTSFDLSGFVYIISDINIEPITKETGEAKFETQSQYSDLSLYRNLVQKSNESEPEHTIVYVNEIVENAEVPQYRNLTLAGLSLKASRNFTSLDQLRCWLGSGLHVKRLHPSLKVYDQQGSAANRKEVGPSNLFTDLVFYLLTDQTGGAGALLKIDKNNPVLLDKDGARKETGEIDENLSVFKIASRFLHTQKLFFNGVVGDRTNLRQYITDTSPYFLLNFVITDGKFSLKPAIPVTEKNGQINIGPVKIDQLFTAGNILEDSYKLEYLRSEERRPFKAVVRYRQESKNKLPEEKTVQVSLKRQLQKHDIDVLPQEQFDLTQFCTSKTHAIKVAKYFLGIRDLVTHTISFSTTLHGLNLRAGSYIKVITSFSPYFSANNGTVSSTGVVNSLQDMPDDQYKVFFFKTNSQDVEEGIMQVSNGKVSDTTFHDTVFSVKNENVSQNVYIVEQLTFSQEGTVDIVASEHPCDDDGSSKLAKLIASEDSVIIEST
tara:strand:+ start:16 stop:4524 length:4509 start_codon:yes stop_codon:yes gene_type:complete